MVMTDEECKELEKPPSCVPEGIDYCDGQRTIYVTYGGDIRTVHGRPYRTRSLKEFLDFDVGAGDTFHFLPGKYWAPSCKDPDDENQMIALPVRLKGLKGKLDCPIKIRGEGVNTILCGNNAAVPGGNALPSARHFAFFKIIDCAWIEIEDFHVESCWPCFVYIENSQYISVRKIDAIDSNYLIFARGKKTHHILIEKNRWQQDPTGVMWEQLDWEAVHHDNGFYNYLNGGLFGSEKITGSVVIRKNRITDAFNGIRMKAGKDDPKYNLNFEIYENHFERVRDNAIEPERHALNWHMHHNTIKNVHAWFSFDRVLGGWWFIYANRGWFTDRPGQNHDKITGGKIYKFKIHKDKDREKAENMCPVHVFHNSYFSRSKLIKKGETYQFQHRNNAVQFCDPNKEKYDDCVCKEDNRQYFGEDFLCFSFIKDWPNWVIFEADLSNRPFNPQKLSNGDIFNWSKSCHADENFEFEDPLEGNLNIPSNLKYKPEPLEFKREHDWPREIDWTFNPDIVGAFDRQGNLIVGPPFFFYRLKSISDWYDEGPRVVRVMRDDENRIIIIHFSVLLTTPCPIDVFLSDPGSPEPPKKINAQIDEKDRTRITIKLDANWDGPEPSTSKIHLPRNIRSQSPSDLPVTLWACTDDNIVLI